MQPLRDRSELILLVSRRTTIPAVRRAIVDGKVENLGAFSWIVPNPATGGWILRITAKHGTEFLVAVIPHDWEPLYTLATPLDPIPWARWIGDKAVEDNYLYRGDHPEQYVRNRLIAVEYLIRTDPILAEATEHLFEENNNDT